MIRRYPAPYPFDVLGAQTQGVIGYWLVQALGPAHEQAGAPDPAGELTNVLGREAAGPSSDRAWRGKVVERSTSPQLIALQGKYWAMWQASQTAWEGSLQ